MTKAELEEHWQQYKLCIDNARVAEAKGQFEGVLEIAESSWKFIDGMLQFERRQDFVPTTKIDGVSLILEYAPPLFEYPLLDRLQQFLVGKRRITKTLDGDIASEIAQSRNLIWKAHALWNELERKGRCRLDIFRQLFSGTDDEWNRTLRTWKMIGLTRAISANGYVHIEFVTQMDEATVAKCPNCGNTSRHTKLAVLDRITCQRCNVAALFVQIPDMVSRNL